MEYNQDYSQNERVYDQNYTSSNLHQVSGDMLAQDMHQYGGGGFHQGQILHQAAPQQQFQGFMQQPSSSIGAVQFGQNIQPQLSSFALGQGHQTMISQGQQPQYLSQGFMENQGGAQPIGYIVGEPIMTQPQIGFGEASYGGQIMYPGNQSGAIMGMQSGGSLSNYQFVNQQQPIIYSGEGVQFEGMQPMMGNQYSIGQPMPSQSFYGGMGGIQGGGVQLIQGGQFESPYQMQGIPQGFSQGLPQGISQGPPQGFSQGLPQGFSQGIPQGMPQGLPQGFSQGFSQGLPQGFSQGMPQGMPQGFPQGFPQGMPQGLPMRNSFSGFQLGGGQGAMGGNPMIGAPLRNSFSNHTIQPSMGSFGGGYPFAGIQNPPSVYPQGGFMDAQPQLRASLGAAHPGTLGAGIGAGGFPGASGFGNLQQPTQLPTTQFNASNAHLAAGAQNPQFQPVNSQFGNLQQGNPTYASNLSNKPVLGGGNVDGISLNKNREYDSLSKKR